tara:strand:- start:17047 stop:17436 length:390 start_codon:yes stop_codon:yes gene_type:complete
VILLDSPANKIKRLLIGVMISFSLMTALAISEGLIRIIGCSANECTEQSNFALIFPIILFFSVLSYFIMRFSDGKEYEKGFFDNWISREEESEMRSRLEQEQLEASGDNMGAGWSEMEKKHLETKLEEG